MPIATDGERVNCKSCSYMDASNPALPFCRRYPAQLINSDAGLRALYPVVNPLEDWCGEHSKYCATPSSTPLSAGVVGHGDN